MLDGLDVDALGEVLLHEISIRLLENDLVVRIVELYLVGSLVHRADSDLDVVMVYEGNYREDDLFNVVFEFPIVMDDIVVDVDPRHEFEPNGPYIRVI